jgi:RHS repeat-associated protein
LPKFSNGNDLPVNATGNNLGATLVFADELGSITSLTNGRALPELLGNTTVTSSISNPFQYTGREWDSETGLYYYRARYYEPAVGRFISEDPTGNRSGTNIYAYVDNREV